MRFVAVKNIACEGVGLLGEAIRLRGGALMEMEPSLLTEPVAPDSYDALIVLGGPMNVYETQRYPHLTQVDRSIQLALQAGKPFLGICLGAQLLVKNAGGKVVPNGVKEIGLFEMSLTAEGLGDPLFEGLGDPLTVFQWHGDRMEPTSEMVTLALSQRCPVQAVRVGDRAYGLQFHLETTVAMVKSWTDGYDAELAAEAIDPKELRARFEAQAGALAGLARTLFGRFVDRIARRP